MDLLASGRDQNFRPAASNIPKGFANHLAIVFDHENQSEQLEFMCEWGFVCIGRYERTIVTRPTIRLQDSKREYFMPRSLV